MRPLNKGDFYEIHTAYLLALIHSTCSSNRQSEHKVTRKHTNYITPPSRTLFSEIPTALRYAEKQPLY